MSQRYIGGQMAEVPDPNTQAVIGKLHAEEQASTEKTLPVYIRVGDGAEYEIGTITADSTDYAGKIAGLLRAMADVIGAPE